MGKNNLMTERTVIEFNTDELKRRDIVAVGTVFTEGDGTTSVVWRIGTVRRVTEVSVEIVFGYDEVTIFVSDIVDGTYKLMDLHDDVEKLVQSKWDDSDNNEFTEYATWQYSTGHSIEGRGHRS